MCLALSKPLPEQIENSVPGHLIDPKKRIIESAEEYAEYQKARIKAQNKFLCRQQQHLENKENWVKHVLEEEKKRNHKPEINQVHLPKLTLIGIRDFSRKQEKQILQPN